jgi:hypothetical protein
LHIFFFSQLEHVYANENRSYLIEKKNKNNDLDFIIKKIELNKDEELLFIDKHSKKKINNLSLSKNSNINYLKKNEYTYYIKNIDINNGILFKTNFHKDWEIYFLRDEEYFTIVNFLLNFVPFENIILNKYIYTSFADKVSTINNFIFFFPNNIFPSKHAIIFFNKNLHLKYLYLIAFLGLLVFIVISVKIFKKNEVD